MTNYRRLKHKSRDKLTDEQKLERKRAMNRLRQKKRREMFSTQELRERTRQDSARCYRWEAILPHVDKDPETGCWVWRGTFENAWGHRVRPVVRAGWRGKAFADHVVLCLHRGAPLPPRCFVRSSCGRIDCVSPEHLLVSNSSVERAKRRLAHEQEKERERRAG